MQITIQHNDIEQAIKEFLANKGLTMGGKDVSVSFQTTRKGGTKISAVVSFSDKAQAIPGYTQPELTLVAAAPKEVAAAEEPALVAAAEEQETQHAAAEADLSAEAATTTGSNSLFS